MNDVTVPLLGIAGAMVVGAMSPGPSFVMVALALSSAAPRSAYLRYKAWSTARPAA